MLTTRALSRLALAVLVLWATSAAMGQDYDGPANIDGIVWVATLLSTVVLIVLSLAVFARRVGAGRR